MIDVEAAVLYVGTLPCVPRYLLEASDWDDSSEPVLLLVLLVSGISG